MNRMVKFVEAQFQSGVLLQTGGLKPIAEGGAVVRSQKGKLAVKDGPYAETKEIVDGFGFIEVKSRDEAIKMTRSFLEIAGDSECALYPIEE